MPELDPREQRAREALMAQRGGSQGGAAAPQQAPGLSPFHQGFQLPGGRGWAPGAGEAYNQMGGLDARGLPTIRGTVPWQAGALNWQDMHNQAVWDYRQRLMGGAREYLSGALGNLQTFRPGGFAAMESGVYGQMANTMMQQAAMTEPLDLLSDWRRNEEFNARRRARNAATMSMMTGLASAGIMALAGPAGMAAAPAMMGGTMAGQQRAMNQTSQQVGQEAFGMMQTGGGQQQARGMQGPTIPQGSEIPGMGTMLGPGVGSTGQVPQGQIGQPYSGPMSAPQQGGGNQQARMGGEGGQQQRGMQGGAGGMGMGPGFGSNGDFGPLAMASMKAAQPSPMQPMRDMAMTRMMVNMVESDPTFQAIDAAIARQAAMRAA